MFVSTLGHHGWPPKLSFKRRVIGAGVSVALAGMLTAVPADAAQAILTAPLASPARGILYGGDASFPPYEYLDEKGRPAGLNVDLIRAVARAEGLEVRIQLQPWARVRAGLLTGEVEVATMYRSPQRAREADFAIPHELIYHEMFIRRGSPHLASLADLAGKRVLVQTDTYSADVLTELGCGPGLRRVARIALERVGFRVTEARDGEEAIEVAGRAGPFDLVISDVVMPRRGGPQMVAELRLRQPALLVLFISGYVGEEEDLDPSAPGTAFLPKPFTSDELLAATRRLMAAGFPAPASVVGSAAACEAKAG
jgi:CheY-like chemotaxis protein